jgi:hypothetical protein
MGGSAPKNDLSEKETTMPSAKGRAWKNERASVTVKGRSRPRSNKYSASDTTERPGVGERERVWVGGYTRADGTQVKGYYRSIG